MAMPTYQEAIEEIENLRVALCLAQSEEPEMTTISENDKLRAQIDYLTAQVAQLQRPRDGAEVDRMKAAFMRCDSVLSPFGERATEPTPADTELTYRRRLFQKLAPRTERFKQSRFDSAPVEVLDAVEEHLYREVQQAFRNDAQRPGVLVPVEERDESGRKVTRFYGDPMAWMSHFTMAGAHGSFVRPSGDR